MPYTLPRAASVALLLILSAGCESILPLFYSVPVRQGNYLDQAMVGQLHSGMTRQQAQRIMGTPLITDPFHQDRWDYYYQYKKDGKITDQRHVVLFFRGDALERIEGVVE